jgi:recombinational DNA repair protein (RecF pathway)
MPDIYALLTGAAAALAVSDDPGSLVPRFQLRLLDALGLAPPPESCVRCGGEFSDAGAWLDVDAGGLACERCGGARGDANRLSPDDVANFRGVGAARGGPIPAQTLATPRTARAVDELITYHLGKRPKSRALVGSGLSAGR